MVRGLPGLILFLAGGAMASTCPEAGPGGTWIDLTEASATTHRAQAIAGGPVTFAACAATAGRGSFGREPDFSIAGVAAPLALRSEGDCDTLLLVAAADGGWYFDDDGGGADHALVTIAEPAPGPYRVWVGTVDRGSCRARLIVERGGG